LRRLLRRLAVPTGDSPISEILEWSDPAAAARWRDATSDAGRYLLGLAEWKGQIPDLLDHVVAVQSAIERSGVWEGYDEWRIGTASTHRIERQGVNYRVSTECGDVFAATWLVRYRTSGDPWEAAEAATCAASLAVEAEGWAGVPDAGALDAALAVYRRAL